MSVRNFLSLPLAIQSELVRIVSTKGWDDSPLSEDNLSSKKLSVTTNFRIGGVPVTNPWHGLGQVNEACLLLFCSYLSHKTTKLPKADFERVLEHCTFAHHAAEMACKAVPNIRVDLQECFLGRIATADPVLESELESALNSRDPNFHVRDLPTIAHLLNTTLISSNGGTAAAALERELNDAKVTADQHAWELFLRELDYDKKCIRVHLVNVLAADRSQMQERSQWKSKVRNDLKANVSRFMNTTSTCVNISVPEKERRGHMVAKFQEVISIAAKRFAVEPASVITIPLINYSAPSVIIADSRGGLVNALQFILNQNRDNVAVILTPSHTNKKGEMWMSEQAIVKMFSATCNMDNPFSLLFSDRCHQRDERPMMYPGRILTPKGADPSPLWAQSSLLMNGYVGPVKQIPPRDMDSIQSLDASALPTGERAPRGGQKHHQIGVEAWSKIISSLFEGVTLSSKQVVLALDCCSGVTHCFHGALNVHRSMPDQFPLHWAGFFEGEDAIEWWQHQTCDVLTSQVIAGTCTLPGVPVVDLNAAAPPAVTLPFPPLKRCVWLPAKDKELVPGAIISDADERVWTTHCSFASDFKTVSAEFSSECGIHGDRQL